MTNIFTADQPSKEDADKLTLDDLVGEGKKYADANDLAKALGHANLHISNLEKEKKEVLEDLKARQSVEDAIKALEAKNGRVGDGTPPSKETPDDPPDAKGSGFTQEDIEKLLDQREAQRRATQNFEKVQSKIKEFTGSDSAARAYVQSKLNEIGMSGQDMEALATKSPDLVLKLLDVGSKAPDGTLGVKGARLPNTPENSTADEKLLQELKSLRSTDPAKYHSPKVRQQIYDLEMKIRKSKV